MFSVERVQLPPRLELYGHGHASLHLCLVERGGFRERHADGWQHCEPGTLRISPADASHELSVGPSGLSAWLIELESPRSGLAHDRFLDARRSPLVAALWESLAAGDRWRSECLVFELLAACEREGPTQAPRWLRRLRSELDRAWQAPPRLHELAARHARHPAHVARSFANWYGRSIGEHLRARRVFEATQRLRRTDDSLVVIASELGFNDQAHFTHAFRDRHGMTPGRFRRSRRS